MSEEEPKIIIDEDWKAQVERERKEAAKATQETPPGEVAKGQPAGTPFDELVSWLAFQGFMALGAIAPRGQETVQVDLEGGRFFIDALMVLRDKTKGNLTPAEQGALTSALAEMQQIFVLRSQQLQEEQLRQAGMAIQKP